ncbi:transmembrane 7 superfamily member 3-like isoform X1 [Leguminivora glycinivorella]|uniref:transmembrane 7 superfamily member 3-like isoform X1 n=1 Tax=Leguminivora glycinivorella TaxID=1035111 RepID=UPI00200F9815|nr:transmembrane 7 superfamily member 3-like isoform X1 [Leguminivora glycinivorella]
MMLHYILIILYICASINGEEVQESTFVISLNDTYSNEELYSSIINIQSKSKTHFQFTNVNKNISFIVFQMHSHLYNITMRNETCFNNKYRACETLTGTNVGLFSTTEPISNMSVTNPNDLDLKVLIAVHGYIYDDPVPGGCNLDGPIEIPAFVSTAASPHRDYISVTAPAPSPSLAPNMCEQSLGSLIFYRLYLPERDFSIDTYFAGIKTMMSYSSVLEHGEKIPQTHPAYVRRTVSAYPGTGAVFAAVALFATSNGSVTTPRWSIYVPTVTYVCSPLVEGDCMLLGDLLSQTLCASLLFVGLFVCYFGHKFFKTEMFIFGMLSGVVVTYILISLMAEMDQTPLIGASFLSGILFGFIWLTFWWFYGIPVFSVLLVTLTFGFFAACVLYHQIPGGLIMLLEDLNFWTLFILVMLLTAVILTPATYPANILCCSVLGAYAAIYPIDYCLGSNLKYIIINTVRRATVEKFHYAVLSPPFEKNDALLILVWVMLATTGFLFQHYHNRGKPPFPPPPRNIRERPEGYGSITPYTRLGDSSDPPFRSTVNLRSNENTPLLA